MTRRRGRPPARVPAACAACICLALTAGCTSPESAPPRATIHWAPDPAAGVESVVDIRLHDTMARPVTGARLRLEAFMTHPGMAPVSAAVDEQGSGRYRARVRFTMGGDWVVRLQGEGADGRAIDLLEHVRGVRADK